MPNTAHPVSRPEQTRPLVLSAGTPTGSDSYRFGGQRICDNSQVRTTRLDALVWEQVVHALKHPQRLKHEYERRLDVLEKDNRVSEDISALRKRRQHLEKGKSRLIDSYASGVIDKEDFEPKIGQLKLKLQHLEEQMERARTQEATQAESFLVINRLEEFASKVDTQLESPDFNTRREIIRALVKRVEIHKDEIIVVLRIDPDSSANGEDNNSTTQSKGRGQFMQGCTGRTIPVARQHRA